LPPFRELFALYSCFFCDLSHCLSNSMLHLFIYNWIKIPLV
jgi:hypothetical protein